MPATRAGAARASRCCGVASSPAPRGRRTRSRPGLASRRDRVVALFGAFVDRWFGWVRLARRTSSPFSGFHVARLSLELLGSLAALVALRPSASRCSCSGRRSLTWFFVTDLLSGGGDWSAVVTLFVGLVFLAVAPAGRRRPRPAVRVLAARRRRPADRRQPALVPARRPLRVGADRDRRRSSTSCSLAAVGRSSWAVFGSLGILVAQRTSRPTPSFSHASVSTSGVLGGAGPRVPSSSGSREAS